MACYAHLEHRFIAEQIVHQSSAERIAAAPSRLLEQFAMDQDYRILAELVDKGIIAGSGGGKLGLTKSDCKAAVLAKRIKEKL